MMDEFVTRLSDDLVFPVTKEQDKNVFYLSINKDIVVTINDLDPGVLFFSRLTILHKDFREEIFTYVMRANLLGKGTFNSVIGMETDEKFLTLSRSIPYEIDYAVFSRELEVFTNSLVFWREELTKKYEQAKQSII